jgi:hypothetical protein
MPKNVCYNAVMLVYKRDFWHLTLGILLGAASVTAFARWM